MNAWLRPKFDRIVDCARQPVSVLLHCLVYLGWWLFDPESQGLVICMSLEAILLGLAIIDSGVRDRETDLAYREQVDREALRAIPAADERVVDEARR